MPDDNEISHERVQVGVWPADPEFDPDNAIVVQIDSDGDSGHVRVNLNDAVLYDGVPGELDIPEAVLLRQTFRRLDRLEAAAIQLGHDLGSLRGDLATRARELGLKL